MGGHHSLHSFLLHWDWQRVAAWQGRDARRLEELFEHGQARASQHWSPEGKRSGERKRPIFHTPSSGMICVQPDKHWPCFEGNLGETGERWDGVRMGLSECYDAILNWNWNCEWYVCLFVGCLTSQQQASVSQGRICSDNFTCCHTEIEVADPTFYLTQSQCTDTGPTSPSIDPITPGAWQGSHWSANFEVTGMTRPRKNPQAGFEPGTFRSGGGRLNHWANEAVCEWYLWRITRYEVAWDQSTEWFTQTLPPCVDISYPYCTVQSLEFIVETRILVEMKIAEMKIEILHCLLLWIISLHCLLLWIISLFAVIISLHCLLLQIISFHCLLLQIISLHCLLLQIISLHCLLLPSLYIVCCYHLFTLFAVTDHLFTLFAVVDHLFTLFAVTDHLFTLFAVTDHLFTLFAVVDHLFTLQLWIILHCLLLQIISLHCLHCLLLWIISLHCLLLWIISLHCLLLWIISFHCLLLHSIYLTHKYVVGYSFHAVLFFFPSVVSFFWWQISALGISSPPPPPPPSFLIMTTVKALFILMGNWPLAFCSNLSEVWHTLTTANLLDRNVVNRAWISSRKRRFSQKWKSKIAEQNTFCGEEINKHTFFSMKIKMMGLWMQIEGRKLIFIMNFSVLDFFKFASRMPQFAQSFSLDLSNFFFQGSMPPHLP